MNNLIPILLFTVSTSISPGPNNFMLLSSGLNHGVKRSLPHFWGICLGFSIMAFLVAIGLGFFFSKYPIIKEVLKYIGSIYMLYLAWKIYRASDNTNAAKISKPLTFIQAFLFQWLNPKAWIMVIGAISIFSLSTNFILNAISIGSVFLFVYLPCGILWLCFGAVMQKFLKDKKQQRLFNTFMAILLATSVVTILFE